MIVEVDDFHEHAHRMDLLVALREANPQFRCTVFAVPYLCPDAFLESLPEWVEVAVHGWSHKHQREAATWSRDRTLDVLLACNGRFVDGFKAPGYAISEGTYTALFELGWWVRDLPSNDRRRPEGLRVFRGTSGDYWCDTVEGLPARFPNLLARVRMADGFELVSEAAREWWAPVAA